MTEPYYADGPVTLYAGDCLDVLATLPDASVDAVVTDPPYGLEFMGKEWDRFDGRALWNDQPHGEDNRLPTDANGVSTGLSRWTIPRPTYTAGHPFQAWCELWAAECLRVLKPGGHLLAFGGTRTSHRLACAIEDAGFEIRDSIAWLYGCLSDDTEILTDEGWVRYDRAREGQRALAFHTESGALAWQPIQHVHRYWHDGEMVRLHSDHTDQLLTPNHRVVLDTESRVPYASNLRDLLDRVLEAERMGQEDEGTLLLVPVQRGPTWRGMEGARAQGPRGMDGRESGVVHSEDDRAEQPRMEGRRYCVQEARELCRRAVREGAGVGATNGPQGRLHHGAPATDGGAVRLPADTAGSHQPRGPQPQEQPAGQPDPVAVEPGAQALRVGQDGGRRLLPSTRVAADFVGYAGVVWCITVGTGAFIARRNGLIFATGNSGFPKSLDVSKAIDKAAGAEREVVGLRKQRANSPASSVPMNASAALHEPITAPATDDARTWQGWGTALKPAHEPIVVARKPLTGTVSQNVLTHGTGALNVDGCRVEGDVPTTGSRPKGNAWGDAGFNGKESEYIPSPAGRWPANVVLDEAQAAALDLMSGTLTSGANPTRRGASRFMYVAKADSAERPRYRKADADPKMLAGSIRKRCVKCGKQEVNVGSSACSCPEPDFKPDATMSGWVSHPTVKPLALMRWLVRLVTPPGGTVLEPFAGSGATVEACLLEGFRCIAIEREADYLPLIVSRLAQGVLDFETPA